MKCLSYFSTVVSMAIFATPAVAQEYWEYAPWEGEWELHKPTEGLEYEYENGELADIEQEGYEYEPGEGYHEQEWYDPDDWFNNGGAASYETDSWGNNQDNPDEGWADYNYGSDYGYDYDYNYFLYDQEEGWEYGWHRDRSGDWEYGWYNEQVAGNGRGSYDYDLYDVDVNPRNRGDEQRSRAQRDRSQETTAAYRGDAQQRRQDRRDRAQTGRVSGEILSMRKVNVRDTRRQIAKIDARRGEDVIVDLGPAERFNMDLSEGERITARGFLTTSSNGQPVLVARQVQTSGQGQNDARRDQIPAQDRQRNTVQVSGEVSGTQTANVRGQQRQIVMLRTNDNKRLRLDVGRRGEIDVQEGDRLSARGILMRTASDGRGIIVATSVTHDGETAQLRQLQSNRNDRPQAQNRDQNRNRNRDRNRDQDRDRDR